jgi:hypothetical protein
MSPPVKSNTNSSPSISISAAQDIIGVTVTALFDIGLLFLGFTSLGGAFLPGCPFRSALSSAIRFISEILSTLLKWTLHGNFLSERVRKMWSRFVLLIRDTMILPLCIGLCSFILIATAVNIGIWSPLLFLTTTSFPLAVMAQQNVDHKPQKYKISHWALWVFLPPSMIVTLAYSFLYADANFIVVTIVTSIGLEIVYIPGIWIFSEISKSMADTGEIDAIAWLLKTAPPQDPAEYFKKAAQMTDIGSIGFDYRPRLLESLMPFLTLLIIPHHAPENPNSDTHSPSSSLTRSFDENLEIYIACLARLSEFTDSEGSFKCLWENAKQHPKLEPSLIVELVKFTNLPGNSQDDLRNAAFMVLNNYGLDKGGKLKSVGGPAITDSEGSHGVAVVLKRAASSVATFLWSAASWMGNVIGLNSQKERRLERSNTYGLEQSTPRVER